MKIEISVRGVDPYKVVNDVRKGFAASAGRNIGRTVPGHNWTRVWHTLTGYDGGHCGKLLQP